MALKVVLLEKALKIIYPTALGFRKIHPLCGTNFRCGCRMKLAKPVFAEITESNKLSTTRLERLHTDIILEKYASKHWGQLEILYAGLCPACKTLYYHWTGLNKVVLEVQEEWEK